MSIKITDKILSVPPYISTSWARIAALHMKGSLLAITLVDGDTLHIPNLNSETIHLIFQHHATYLDKEYPTPSPSIADSAPAKNNMESQGKSAIRLTFGTSLDGLGNMMQHNPDQIDAPDLPPEILQQIGTIAKIITPPDELVLPKAELNCNCFHCQIIRALNPESPSPSVAEETEVLEQDLQFQQWSITQTGENLFCVINRLDEHEKYNVFLGQPVGCTCGQSGCEHILAVLKS